MTRDPPESRRGGAALPERYAQVVFSGGGLRCFWHGGWMAAVERRLHPFRPRRVTGSSGGALSAAAWLANRETFLFERFARAIKRQDRNLTLADLDKDDPGRSPHQRVYEMVVEDVIDDDAQARIADGPGFQISVATPGDAASPTLRALLAGAIYQVEQIIAPTPRPRLSSAAGIEARLVDARAAARRRVLPELIRMAATVPPAFRPGRWDDEPIFDGGMIDKAPLPDPDAGATLVLLTKRFSDLPDDDPERVHYAGPGEPVLSGSKLDFTDPALLEEAWDQGEEDGRDWCDRVQGAMENPEGGDRRWDV